MRHRLALLSPGIAALALLPLLGTTGASSPPPVAQGIVKANVPEFTLKLLGDRGQVEVHGRRGVARVAPGRYWLVGWNVELPDPKGRRWAVVAATFGSLTSAQYLVVTRQKPVTVQLGPPLKAELGADAVGNRVNFTLNFLGPSGERCGSVKVDGERPPRPWLTIRDAAGQVVARTEFDYGCAFFCHFVWRAPQELKGRYTATVDFDFGPIAVASVTPISVELAGVDPNAVAARPGAEAPDFTLKTVEDGQPIQLQRLRPNSALLCFFCGCPLCAEVATRLAGARPSNTEVVAVFSEPELCTPEGARSWRQRTGFRGTILADPGATVAGQYDSVACPRCWIIDDIGMIRYVNAGPETPPKEIVAGALKALAR